MNLEVDASVATPGTVLVAHAIVEDQAHQRVLRCLLEDDLGVFHSDFTCPISVTEPTPFQVP